MNTTTGINTGSNTSTAPRARVGNASGTGGALADVLNAVISEGMNTLGADAGCPALYWALEPGRGTAADGAVNSLIGHAHGYSESTIARVLDRWARAWSMTATPDDLALREFGITQYTATVPYRPLGTLVLVVWGVTDRAAFDRFLNARSTRRQLRNRV